MIPDTHDFRFANPLTWLVELAAHHRQAIEDVLVSMAPQGAKLAVGVVSAILLARGLGPEGMGQYALIMSVCLLVAQLSDLGIGPTAVRFASRAVALGRTALQHAVLRWAFRLRMAVALLLSAGAYLLVPWITDRFWHAPDLAPLVRLGLLIGIFTALGTVPMIYFQSLKRFRVNAVVGTAQSVALLAGVLILAAMQWWTVAAVVRVSVLATSLGALAFLALVPRAALVAREDIRGRAGPLLKRLLLTPEEGREGRTLDATSPTHFALYMMLSSAIVTVTLKADVWLMGYYLDKAEIGVYDVATRFTLPLLMLLGAINTALWPRASALVSMEATGNLLPKTLKLIALASGAVAAYAMLVPLLAPWLFGAEYAAATVLAQLLCLRYCIALLISPVGILGYNYGLVKCFWLINLLQLGVVLAINIVLLPKVGALGGAFALIANDVVGGAMALGIIFQRVRAARTGM